MNDDTPNYVPTIAQIRALARVLRQILEDEAMCAKFAPDDVRKIRNFLRV